MAGTYGLQPELGIAPTASMSSHVAYDTSIAQPQSQSRHHHHQHTPPSQANTPQNMQLQTQTQQQPPRSVKRPRPVKSCTECRKRKLRCDRLCPCSQCQKSNRMCKYANDNDSGNLSDASDDETSNSTRPAKRNCHPCIEPSYGPVANGDVTAAPTPLEVLSSRMDRLERHVLGRSLETGHGGWQRPIEISPETIRGLSVKNGGTRTRLYGPSSPRVLLNLFDEAKDFMRDHAREKDTMEIFSSFKQLHKLLRVEYQKSLSPISVFVDSMMPIQKRMTDILPKKHICDRLLQAYFNTNETIYRIVHAPTFKSQYDRYWEGKGHSDAFLPQLLAILSIACRFDTKSRGLGHERSEGVHLPTASALVRIWLNGLRGKQLVELETLQVELSLLMTQRMFRENNRDGWTQLGTVVRMALDMGLDRDPSEFGSQITPFNQEMRRRLWASVSDLDYFVSNDCNMPSMLREGDSTTQAPRNIDDVDLYQEMAELPPSKPFDQMTDMQIQAYASLTRSVRVKAAALVRRIDTITDWSEIIDVGSRLERHIEEINAIIPRHQSVGNTQKARLWRSLILLDGHVRRPLLNLYRPFTLGVPNVPSQILRGYLRSSMAIIRYIQELDLSMPDYNDINDMVHMTLKGDIEQAALSICYYIRAAMRPVMDGTTLAVQQALRMSQETDGAPHNPIGLMWSMPRLVETAEKVLEFLIRNIKRGDTKDIICLSLVIESVRTVDSHPDKMAQGLRAVLDSCLRAANCSHERLATAQTDLHQAEIYGAARPAYVQQGVTGSGTGSGGWTFWDGWE